jgi:hypothetical protein
VTLGLTPNPNRELGSVRGEIKHYNDNQFVLYQGDYNMKKIVVAALTLVGLAAVVTFVAKNLDN